MANLEEKKICRACLQADGTLASLFEKRYPADEVSFCDMIFECTGMTIDPQDEFPPFICCGCVEKLRSAYDFKTQYEKSHRALIACLKSIKTDGSTDSNDSAVPLYEEQNLPLLGDPELLPNSKPIVKTEIILPDEIKLETDAEELNSNSTLNQEVCHLELASLKSEEDHVVVKSEPGAESISSEENHVVIKSERGAEDETDQDFSSRSTDEPNTSEKGKKLQRNSFTKKYLEEEEERRFKCDQCHKAFRKKTQLREHQQVHSNERPHICPKCPKRFSWPTSLRKHMDTHGGKFQCSSCPQSFGRENLLKRHKVVCGTVVKPKPEIDKSDPRPYKCDQCPKSFKINYDLNLHTRVHTKERPYKCTLCDKSYSRLHPLKKHAATHNGEFQCSVCESSYIAKRYLVQHESKAHGIVVKRKRKRKGRDGSQNSEEIVAPSEAKTTKDLVKSLRPFRCIDCPKTFKRKEHLVAHQACHSSDKPYECTICLKKFSRKLALNTHMSGHGGDFKCNFCHRSYGKEWSLKRHEIETHGVERRKVNESVNDGENEPSVSNPLGISIVYCSRSFQCKECQKVFKSKRLLKLHALGHTKELRHECTVCQKKFKRKNGLYCHMLAHGDEFKCRFCDQSFGKEWFMKMHERRVHNVPRNDPNGNDTPDGVDLTAATKTEDDCSESFKCDECPRVFKKKCGLLRHKIYHKEANFAFERKECKMCGKKYRTCYLKTHMREHHQQKRFKCSFCGEAFCLRYILNKHMIRMHKDLLEEKQKSAHQCQVCGEEFESNSSLDEHKQMHSAVE